MKLSICEKCGSHEFVQKNNLLVCKYCLTEYTIEPDDLAVRQTTIALDNDIINLLKKCQDDPANARRYASLVLDIDPNNSVAQSYFIPQNGRSKR